MGPRYPPPGLFGFIIRHEARARFEHFVHKADERQYVGAVRHEHDEHIYYYALSLAAGAAEAGAEIEIAEAHECKRPQHNLLRGLQHAFGIV